MTSFAIPAGSRSCARLKARTITSTPFSAASRPTCKKTTASSMPYAARSGWLRRSGENDEMSTPHPHTWRVSNAERVEVVARRRGRRVDASAATMKAADVSRDRSAQPRYAVRLGVSAEVRMIRGEPDDAGSLCCQLTETTNHELGRRVNDVRLEPSHDGEHATVPRRSQSNVGIQGEGDARNPDDIIRERAFRRRSTD